MEPGFAFLKMPIWSSTIFFTHKEGETAQDYQDSSAAGHSLRRYAVADGAGQSFLPAPWASFLVEGFCKRNDPTNLDLFKTKDWVNWLTPFQAAWQQEADKVAQNSAPEKYYIRNRYHRKDPAGATFAGIEFFEAENKWQAMIIGDSCIFHVYGDQVQIYLLQDESQFNFYPECFLSNALKERFQPTFIGEKKYEPNDLFLLATDALSKWIIREAKSTDWSRTVQRLLDLKDEAGFLAFVQSARHDPHRPMENDDVTLMILREKISVRLGSAPKIPTEEPLIVTSPTLPISPDTVPVLESPPGRRNDNRNNLLKEAGQKLEKYKKDLRASQRQIILLRVVLMLSLGLNLCFACWIVFRSVNHRPPVSLTPPAKATFSPVPMETPTSSAPVETLPSPAFIETLPPPTVPPAPHLLYAVKNLTLFQKRLIGSMPFM